MSTSSPRQILVTGGTSGIGAGIARGFAAQGERVLATGATQAEVDRARADPAHAGIDFAVLDVRDEAAVRACIDALPRLDAVVNCAGIILRAAEHELAAFERVMDINLNGTMRVCAAAREKLAASGGSIVNTASMRSFSGAGAAPAYASSKGAVAQLTKSLAIAYAPQGVRVNAIAPGWIATPLTRALQDDPKASGDILGRTPMGRWGTPEDLVGPVLFLTSPAAAFVTGAILPVDGGYLVV